MIIFPHSPSPTDCPEPSPQMGKESAWKINLALGLILSNCLVVAAFLLGSEIQEVRTAALRQEPYIVYGSGRLLAFPVVFLSGMIVLYLTGKLTSKKFAFPLMVVTMAALLIFFSSSEAELNRLLVNSFTPDKSYAVCFEGYNQKNKYNFNFYVFHHQTAPCDLKDFAGLSSKEVKRKILNHRKMDATFEAQ